MSRIIKSKHVFKGRLLNLYLQRQRYPNGYVGDLEVIRHPGAVLIVPYLAEGRVVLIKQYRPVIDDAIWELPAGTLKRGERALSCAKRELIEEIGYSSARWKRIGLIYPAPGYTTEKIAIYEARRIKKVTPQLQEDEIITPRVFSKREIAGLVHAGKIVDGKTICALALAKCI